MVGFSLGKKKDAQPAQQPATSGDAEAAAAEFVRTVQQQEAADAQTATSPREISDADAAAAIEGGSRASSADDDHDPVTAPEGETRAATPGPDVEEGVASILKEQLKGTEQPGGPDTSASGHRRTENLSGAFDNNGQQSGTGKNNTQDNGTTKPDEKKKAGFWDRFRRTAGAREQQGSNEQPQQPAKETLDYDDIDALVKKRSKAWVRLIEALEDTYGDVYIPVKRDNEFDEKINDIAVTSKIKGHPIQRWRTDFSLAHNGKKEIHIARNGVHLEKNTPLTEDRAVEMAMLVYLNPAAHSEGLTLEGTPEEQRMLLDALRKVEALNPAIKPIRVHNLSANPVPQPTPTPTTQAATQAASQPSPQPQPAPQPRSANGGRSSAGEPQPQPTNARTVEPQPQEMKQTIAQPGTGPTTGMSIERTDSTVKETTAAPGNEGEATVTSASAANEQNDSAGEKAACATTPADAKFSKPAGKAKADAQPHKEAFKSAVGKKWEPSEDAINQARTYIERTEDPTLGSLQEHFGIGETKAHRVMEALEKEGVVARDGDHKTAGWKLVPHSQRKAGSGAEAHIS